MDFNLFDAGGGSRQNAARGRGGAGRGRGRGGRGGAAAAAEQEKRKREGEVFVMGGATNESDPLFDSAAAAAAQPQKKKKARVQKVKITPFDVADKLSQIYKTFPSIKLEGKGHEAADLKRILSKYEEWARSIDPYCPFDNFVQKLEKFGSSAIIQHKLQIIRDVACGYRGEESLFVGDSNDNGGSDNESQSGGKNKESELVDVDVDYNPDKEIAAAGGWGDDDEQEEWAPLHHHNNNTNNTTSSSSSSSAAAVEPVVPTVLTDEQKLRIERNRQLAKERFEKKQAELARLKALEQGEDNNDKKEKPSDDVEKKDEEKEKEKEDETEKKNDEEEKKEEEKQEEKKAVEEEEEKEESAPADYSMPTLQIEDSVPV